MWGAYDASQHAPWGDNESEAEWLARTPTPPREFMDQPAVRQAGGTIVCACGKMCNDEWAYDTHRAEIKSHLKNMKRMYAHVTTAPQMAAIISAGHAIMTGVEEDKPRPGIPSFTHVANQGWDNEEWCHDGWKVGWNTKVPKGLIHSSPRGSSSKGTVKGGAKRSKLSGDGSMEERLDSIQTTMRSMNMEIGALTQEVRQWSPR